MIRQHTNKAAHNQRGQAATEFIIASVFVLIPLFLLIPILGKYIDIRHAAINKARFEAWEYTVWNIPGKDQRVDIKDSQSAGERKFKDTRARADHYFFSDPNSTSYADPTASFKANPLWVDHKRDTLFSLTTRPGGSIEAEKTPTTFQGNSPDVLNFLVDGMNVVAWVFDEILKFEHVDGTFDILEPQYRKNFVTSQVTVTVRPMDDILPSYSLGGKQPKPDTKPVTIHAEAAVLTDPWNSGSSVNASSEARGLVFTAFLSPLSDAMNSIIEDINNGLEHIPLISIKLPNMPDFGLTGPPKSNTQKFDDMIPLEFVEESPGEVREKYSLDYYE